MIVITPEDKEALEKEDAEAEEKREDGDQDVGYVSYN